MPQRKAIEPSSPHWVPKVIFSKQRRTKDPLLSWSCCHCSLMSLWLSVKLEGGMRRHAESLGQPGLQVWLQPPSWRGDSPPTAREGCARPHTARGLTAEDSAPAWVGHGHRKSKPVEQACVYVARPQLGSCRGI